MAANDTSTPTERTPIEKLSEEGTARVEQILTEFGKFEAQQHHRTIEMIDEGARVMKASLEFGLKLSDEWRKMAVQTNRQVMEMFVAPKWF